MKKKFSDELAALKAKAKASGYKGVKFTTTSGNETALSRVIKTQEQADTFMRILRAL